MKKLLLCLVYFLLTSCVTNYYINVEEDTPIYNNADGYGESVTIIPKGYRVNVTAGKRKYRKIKWESYKGWAINPVYNNSSDISVTDNSSADNVSTVTNSSRTKRSSNKYYRSSSTPTSGGTVYVKGYTRKDGTYVKPHTRSAPKEDKSF